MKLWVDKRQRAQHGFTIVELLIVIVVIAILAAISIVAYNGIQQRARDSRRAQDMSTIKKALLLYDSAHGGVEKTTTFGGSGTGGWNYSAGTNWLSFLESEYGKMPVDPLNRSAGTSASSSSYFYYCYSAGTFGYAEATVVLGYWTESKVDNPRVTFAVNDCL